MCATTVHVKVIVSEEAMTLKECNEGCMGGSEGRKGEWGNCTILLKSQK